jgi:hypothetical protein
MAQLGSAGVSPTAFDRQKLQWVVHIETREGGWDGVWGVREERG